MSLLKSSKTLSSCLICQAAQKKKFCPTFSVNVLLTHEQARFIYRLYISGPGVDMKPWPSDSEESRYEDDTRSDVSFSICTLFNSNYVMFTFCWFRVRANIKPFWTNARLVWMPSWRGNSCFRQKHALKAFVTFEPSVQLLLLWDQEINGNFPWDHTTQISDFTRVSQHLEKKDKLIMKEKKDCTLHQQAKSGARPAMQQDGEAHFLHEPYDFEFCFQSIWCFT